MSQCLIITCSECEKLIHSKGFCESHYKKQYYNNPENLKKKKESDSNWRKIHIEQKRTSNKKWMEENPIKVKISSKKWYDNNKLLHSQRVKECRSKNREQYKLKEREWAKNNPEKRLIQSKKHLEKQGKQFNMNCHEYKWALMSWAKTVRKLDNNMCKLCDSTENLHAHHIMPRSLFVQLSLYLDNGITLCLSCHYKTHGWKGGDAT